MATVESEVPEVPQSHVASGVRNRGVGTALRYKGREGMWTWLLHRATGLGVLLYLIIHVAETAMVIWSPGFYDEAVSMYKSPLFRFAELLIFFSVLFHALNGLRIIIQDFAPYVMPRQRQLAWAAALVAAVVMIPVTWIMVAPLLGLAEEPGAARHIERCQTNPTAPACLELSGGEVAE